MDLLVLCPTRGRPAAAREALQSFEATRSRHFEVEIQFVVDHDDPSDYSGLPTLVLDADLTGNMAKALNSAALIALRGEAPRYLGFIGDDHRFRTNDWDRHFIETLDAKGGGFVYGNDLFWPKGEIPTQVFVSAPIIAALGWFALPGAKHLYLDNTWRTLGEATKALFYMPDVIVEHMHPAGGKNEWDDGYRRVNAPEMYSHDREVYERWLANSSESDIERVVNALNRG